MPRPAAAQRNAAPSGEIPFSFLASDEARRAWAKRNDLVNIYQSAAEFDVWKASLDRASKALPPSNLKILWARHLTEKGFATLVEKQQARYSVETSSQTIGGVYTEIFVPTGGVAAANAHRVLINLHAGGFTAGARVAGRAESIPIAAIAKIKVVSIDYRQAPGHRFPAASEDVAAVYKALLADYRPEDIGIFGCSAGATLAAQSIAWFIDKALPLPGAIGLFCGTGDVRARGDSAYFWAVLNGQTPTHAEQNPAEYLYLKGADLDSPLVFPMRHPDMLRRFPPSLFITGTRSFEMSGVITAHNRLIAAGVRSELRVWEGVMHGFLHDPDLPESREAYQAIASFFDRTLGRPWYATEIEAFVAADLVEPPPSCGIVFTGSSSIRSWHTLARDMAPFTVINRGFGGATIADVNVNFDRVITPYRPRAIVLYAGENDIAFGKTPSQVVADFELFLKAKTAVLGSTPVYVISLKPSKLREAQMVQQFEVNTALQHLAAKRRDLRYIDIVPQMLENGKPRDLYAADGLHMTDLGYDIWTRAVRRAIEDIGLPPVHCRTSLR